jgi:uncharacterized protein DUF1905
VSSVSFETTLERDKDGTWWYAHVPKNVRRRFAHLGAHGVIPVLATVGGTSWVASLMPWADGSAQVVIKKDLREKEGLRLGQELQIRIEARPDAHS